MTDCYGALQIGGSPDAEDGGVLPVQIFFRKKIQDFNVSEKTTRFWGKISRYDAIKIRLIPETSFRGCDQFPEIIR